jgi:surfeit locus 1 family protein
LFDVRKIEDAILTCNLQVNIPAVIPTEVVGVIRGSEKPSIFVPANDPSSFQWFYIDVPAIARAAGLPEDTIYVEDINENVNPSNPYPVPKDVNTLVHSSVMPQDHLNYTLTWYAFASFDINFLHALAPLRVTDLILLY